MAWISSNTKWFFGNMDLIPVVDSRDSTVEQDRRVHRSEEIESYIVVPLQRARGQPAMGSRSSPMLTLAELSHSIRHLVDRLADRWQHATPTDFGMLAVAVIITGWYVSRYLSE